MFWRKKVVFLVALTFSCVLLVTPVAKASPTLPVASFTYTPPAPIFGQFIFFNASASYDPDGGNISSYRWDFDDGTIYSISDPITHHNYTAFGTYNITLTVTDDEAETDTTWQIVTVREYPVASFTYTPAIPIVGETVTFNASSSDPKGGTIVNYEWNFGDGNGVNVTTQSTTHIYTGEGNYNVILAVTDSENLTDTTSKPMTVIDYPIAAFTHSPDRPLVNETVTFDASSSTAEGGTIVSYEWDFGDGTNGTSKIVTHEYTTFGDRNVTLTVTDSENLTDTAWTIVQVRKLPFAFFTYSPAAPLVNEMVTFNASLSTPDGGTIVSYRWDFGDNSPLVTEADPITNHTYTTFGNYTITLTITDSEDLTDDYSDTLRILVHPVASFTYSPDTPIIDETVTYNASASYDPDRYIINYTWNFGDGSPTVTKPNPITTHNYTTEGTYNVTLIVTDDDGLADIVWKLITIYTFVYIHDVAITDITTADQVFVGKTVNITVVAKNEGTSAETFSVTVYCNATSAGTSWVTNLLPGWEETLIFSWNTTGPALGNYIVSAQASVVPGETDTADNTLTNGILKIKMVGDANGDGVIDVVDLTIVALALWSQPGDENWDPQADMGEPYGLIDIVDLTLAAIHLWETW